LGETENADGSFSNIIKMFSASRTLGANF